MTEREKFEAWAKGQQPGTLDLTPFEDTYDSDFTSRAWDAWQARALLAAGASEGQEEPVAWYCETASGHVADLTDRENVVAEWEHAGYVTHALFTHPSAELTALRERIAGMEKDVERYRWLAPRFTGYDFDWMPSEPEAGDGKSVVVFDVGREFRGGRDITAAIGAAIAKEKQ